MKYDDNLIYKKHLGGCDVFIYEVENYRTVVLWATGSSITTFNAKDVPMEIVEQNFFHWYSSHKKPLANEWAFYESLEESIDRQLNKARHPDQILWYEKHPAKDATSGYFYPGQMDYEKLCYSSDSSSENKLKIQSQSNFIGWYDDYWKRVRERNEENKIT